MPPPLEQLLHETFGHKAFRANQEAVCRAATEGADVLLVMPTGAGKSLCYQLPALARGGTALVISPLIALMDDQANKLQQAGLRVARIHSGLPKETARQACRDYLDGNLQFLFIAPERMRVPGFPEMLARRKPSLIAIDEAHCISAWGHDFRPDYRTLGDHLPALRPAPIMALTATATPTVQRDIVAALSLSRPSLFIHGFRRDNLHIEVLELSKPRRTEFVTKFLSDPSRLPAIVYAPSRKAAEELAGELNRVLRHTPGTRSQAAAYHAGLDPATREDVQNKFLSGRLSVVVATIAFGMGIDKADVRTVIHYALPASVEAYYQEIGRAGRDGLPSRTVLLYSYADRKMHDFFLDRDYPPPSDLARVANLLSDNYLTPDYLRQRLKMDADTLARSIEKLSSQGAAVTDFDGNVRRGASSTWQSGYEAQVAHRRQQIDRMMDFAQTQQCRMLALIQHFGDSADAVKACGHCDFCAPSAVTSQALAAPTAAQQRLLRQILLTIRNGPKSTGQIHTALNLPDRKETDDLLDGLARGGLLTLTSETFNKPDGQTISYKKANITPAGQLLDDYAPIELLLRPASEAASSSKRKRSTTSSSQRREDSAGPLTESQKALEANLRAYRTCEAKKSGKPAFIIFGDAALAALVQAEPQSIPNLLQVSGFGPDKAEKYGADIVALCRQTAPSAPQTRRNPPTPVVQTSAPRSPQSHRDEWEPTSAQPDYDTYDPGPPPEDNAPDYDYDSIDIAAYATDQTYPEEPEVSIAPAAAANTSGRLPDKSATRPAQPRRIPDTTTGSSPGSPTRVALNQRYTLAPEPILTNESPTKRTVEKSIKPPASTKVVPAPTQQARPAIAIDPGNLTADQQTLETRLRTWRKSESERLGLPQFFILGTTALRSIILLNPQTLEQLATVSGIDEEKLKKHGTAILNAMHSFGECLTRLHLLSRGVPILAFHSRRTCIRSAEQNSSSRPGNSHSPAIAPPFHPINHPPPCCRTLYPWLNYLPTNSA